MALGSSSDTGMQLMHVRHRFAALLIVAYVAGCAPYPRDPQNTTEHVSAAVMRVGVIHDPPFVRLRAGAPTGREVAMVRALADSLDARVEWVDGGTYELLAGLQHFRLDLVIGGISPDTPWAGHVALTSPYMARDERGLLVRRVTALPPGENRWMMQVERFQRSPRARAILRGTTPDASPASASKPGAAATITGARR